ASASSLRPCAASSFGTGTGRLLGLISYISASTPLNPHVHFGNHAKARTARQQLGPALIATGPFTVADRRAMMVLLPSPVQQGGAGLVAARNTGGGTGLQDGRFLLGVEVGLQQLGAGGAHGFFLLEVNQAYGGAKNRVRAAYVFANVTIIKAFL
ncbi:hypothetical protein, partial [Janthinobacterium sp.]|uniref:hypothetical protein n=1 Tax=Janthinobacterium sp. TaxID=1871054 RepID=UPI0026101BC9